MTRTKHHRRAMPRLIAMLRPESLPLTAGIVFGIASVGLLVAAPWFLGDATNILFGGIISKRIPAGVTKAQAVAVLRAHHQGELARLISAMSITPGAGVDFTRLGQVLGVVALMFLLSSVFGWAMNYMMAGIAVRVVYKLRQMVTEKVGKLPLGYFDSHSHGDVLRLAQNEVSNGPIPSWRTAKTLPTSFCARLRMSPCE